MASLTSAAQTLIAAQPLVVEDASVARAKDSLVGSADRSPGRAKYLTADPSEPQEQTGEGSRALSRAIARRLSESAVEALFSEHADLVCKQVANEMTEEEACRLELVRWILDRVQDAELGPALDELEAVAVLAERTGKRVDDFIRAVRNAK